MCAPIAGRSLLHAHRVISPVADLVLGLLCEYDNRPTRNAKNALSVPGSVIIISALAYRHGNVRTVANGPSGPNLNRRNTIKTAG